MKNLINYKKESLFNSFGNSIFTTLNDIYLDLDIKGFSNSFCALLQLKYANTYAYLVSKNVRLYGLTVEEAEANYNVKKMRHAFACNNIDIDELFAEYNLNYYIEGIRPQIFNEHLCEDVTSNNELKVLSTHTYTVITDESNRMITFN